MNSNTFVLDNPKNVYVVAEAGINHNGSMSIAKQMIESAAKCGCDAVKFQTIFPEELFTSLNNPELFISEKNKAPKNISDYENLVEDILSRKESTYSILKTRQEIRSQKNNLSVKKYVFGKATKSICSLSNKIILGNISKR